MYIAYPECFLFPNFEMLDIDEDENFYRQELGNQRENDGNPYSIIDEEYVKESIEK